MTPTDEFWMRRRVLDPKYQKFLSGQLHLLIIFVYSRGVKNFKNYQKLSKISERTTSITYHFCVLYGVSTKFKARVISIFTFALFGSSFSTEQWRYALEVFAINLIFLLALIKVVILGTVRISWYNFNEFTVHPTDFNETNIEIEFLG